MAGAGIIGASIAWRLSQGGASVRLLDAGPVGSEASWAGAGMLAPGSEFLRQSQWTDLALESLTLYPRFVAELCEESGVAIDYLACGAVESPESAEDRPALRERAATQRGFGIPCEAREGELHYPLDAIVDPREVMRALAEACRRRGVDIREHSPLEYYDTGGAPLVVAAGAWSGGLEVFEHGKPVSLPESTPVKGHLLGYHLAPGSLGRILRRGHTYVLQRSNGFTLAGSNEERVGFDRTVDANIVADIGRRAARLFPALEGRAPNDCWAGFRPATASGALALGRVMGTSVWLAYGHYRNGILLAPSTAQRIACDLLDA